MNDQDVLFQRLQRTNDSLNAQLRRQNAELKIKDQQIEHLFKVVAERDSTIATLQHRQKNAG